jgi:uncharacterized membrane protein (Fun14 family)
MRDGSIKRTMAKRAESGGRYRPHHDRYDRRPLWAPLTSKTFLGSAAAFLGSGGFMLTSQDAGSTGAWLQQFAPAATTLAGSLLGGFLIGWAAKRALRTTIIVAVVVLGVVGLLANVGLDVSAVDAWVNTSVGWLGDHMDSAQQTVTALLPSAGAAGTGAVLGFRRA